MGYWLHHMALRSAKYTKIWMATGWIWCVIESVLTYRSSARSMHTPIFLAGCWMHAMQQLFTVQIRTLINANRFSEAMAQADTAIRLEPDVYKSYVYRGVAGIESGRHEQGLSDLLAAERRHSGDAYLQYHLAMAKLELGRMSEAVAHLEASRTIRPGNPDVHYNLGVLRLQQGMRGSDRKALVDAGEHFRMAIERDRSHAHAVCMLGEVERQLGRTGPAIEMFRRSLSLDGSSPEAHPGLSLALSAAGASGEAHRAPPAARAAAAGGGATGTWAGYAAWSMRRVTAAPGTTWNRWRSGPGKPTTAATSCGRPPTMPNTG